MSEAYRGGVDLWSVALACGHRVGVPAGATGPVVMACVLRHDRECDAVPEVFALDRPFAVPGLFGRAP